jgi:hypothetical protein
VRAHLIMTDQISLSLAVNKAERWDSTLATQRSLNLRKPGPVSFTGQDSLNLNKADPVSQEVLAIAAAVRQNTKCFNCNELGHFAAECTNKQKRSGTPDRQSTRCFNCNELGHFAAECNTKQYRSSRSGTPEYKNYKTYPSGGAHKGNSKGSDYKRDDYNHQRSSRREDYDNRHKSTYQNKNESSNGGRDKYNKNRTPSYDRSRERSASTDYASRSRDRSDQKRDKCYACSGYGHLAHECANTRKKSGERSNSQTRLQCHYCGKAGHKQADCRTRLRSKSPSHTSKKEQGAIPKG